jgi:hypothetical protein
LASPLPKNGKKPTKQEIRKDCDELASFLLHVYKKRKLTEEKGIIEAGENQ